MASRAYPEALFHLKHGYALWTPEPRRSTPVSPGDVGYIDDVGGFERLFNIFSSEDSHDDESHNSELGLGLGVPEGFEPLVLPASAFRMRRSVHNFNAPIKSRWVTVHEVEVSVGVSSGKTASAGFHFKSTKSAGAALVLKSDADRHSIACPILIAHYIKKNYRSWYDFANARHGLGIHDGDLVVVTGCDMTSGWGVAAFCGGEDRDVGISFTTAPAGVAGGFVSATASWSGKWSTPGCWQHRSGPDRPPEASATALQYDREPNRKDQCVFVQGFKIRTRLGKLRPQELVRLKAAAEPKDPDGDHPDDDEDRGNSGGVNLNVSDDGGSSSSSDMDMETEYFPRRARERDPRDIMIDYIWRHCPQAEVAIADDSYWCELTESFESLDDFARLLESLKPDIVVTEDGVGMIQMGDDTNMFSINEPEPEPEPSSTTSAVGGWDFNFSDYANEWDDGRTMAVEPNSFVYPQTMGILSYQSQSQPFNYVFSSTLRSQEIRPRPPPANYEEEQDHQGGVPAVSGGPRVRKRKAGQVSGEASVDESARQSSEMNSSRPPPTAPCARCARYKLQCEFEMDPEMCTNCRTSLKTCVPKPVPGKRRVVTHPHHSAVRSPSLRASSAMDINKGLGGESDRERTSTIGPGGGITFLR